MKMHEYTDCDGVELARLIASGEVTAEEVCRCALRAIEALNPQLNFVAGYYPERVSALAGRPAPGGILGGVPTLLKDFFKYEKGCLTEGGSELSRGLRADHDCELVLRMKRAGLVNLGRSTVPEIAYSSTCDTHLQGLTRNPWNPDVYPGGSSSGAAVATAAGVVPIAHGSDGGGSIRNPASYTGLVGLKPTRGRVSDGPDSADPTAGMSANLALTRTVRDTAAILDALSGPAIGDPHLAPAPARPFLQEIGQPTGRLRVHVTTRAFDAGPVNPEVREAVMATARLLGEMGHEVSERAPTIDWEPFQHATHVVWAAGTAQGCDAIGRLLRRKPSPDNLMRTSWRMYEFGRSLTACDYLEALDNFNLVRRQTGAFFEGCDILLTPTCTQLAQPHATQHQDLDLDAEDWSRLAFRNDVFSPVFNVTGQPAISLPLHQARDRSQIGIQLVARFGEDALLLRLSAALEAALPWRERRAPIHASMLGA
jgi:amidase